MTAAALHSYRSLPLTEEADTCLSKVKGRGHAISSSLELAIVSDRAGFDELDADWNELFGRCANCDQLFQSYNWLWHWANHFLPRESGSGSTRLHILTGRQNGRLVLVLPLVRLQSRGLAKLTFMGDPVSQYGDILIDTSCVSDAELRAAWTYCVDQAKVDAVRLRKVRATSAIAPLLKSLGGLTSDVQSAPYLNFSGSKNFSGYEARYSGSWRRNRRRQQRRLEERGTLSIERIPHGADASDAASLAITLKRAWLKHRRLVSPALADPRTEAFFRDALGGGPKPANCDIAMLKTNGEVAAIELTMTCRDRIAIHVIAYSLKFEKSGAGSLLMEDSIRRACNNGLKYFDMLAPGDSYKLDWADRSTDVCDWSLPLTMAGSLYAKVYLGMLRWRLKSVVNSLPAGLK